MGKVADWFFRRPTNRLKHEDKEELKEIYNTAYMEEARKRIKVKAENQAKEDIQ